MKKQLFPDYKFTDIQDGKREIVYSIQWAIKYERTNNNTQKMPPTYFVMSGAFFSQAIIQICLAAFVHLVFQQVFPVQLSDGQ